MLNSLICTLPLALCALWNNDVTFSQEAERKNDTDGDEDIIMADRRKKQFEVLL